jgi:hypothetical protein
MRWIRRILLAVLACHCLAAHAQDTSCLHRTVPVTVVDNTGMPVNGLAAIDFRAEMRGKPVQIVSLSDRAYAHRILILIDARGSMAWKTGDTWMRALAVAAHFAESKSPNTSLALYIFGERSNERVGFSQSNDAVLKKLREIENDPAYAKGHVWGMSAMRDAMLEGMKFFGTPAAGDEMFVITTTHGDNASKKSTNFVKRALRADGIRAFFCVLSTPYFGGPTPVEQGGVSDMLTLARTAGGGVVGPRAYWDSLDVRLLPTNGPDLYQYCPPFGRPTPPHGSVLSRAILALYDQMGSSQRIEIIMRAPVEKRTEWKLMLSKEASSRFEDVQVVYPRYLESCVAKPAN